MTFEQMKVIESELERLELSAHNAGQHSAEWMAVLAAMHDTLAQCAGRGALDERLQTSQAYETARAALFAAWARGVRHAGHRGPIKDGQG